MKIAILGYGKMGQEIEQVAISRNHKITCVIDSPSDWKKFDKELHNVDVAIEFSTPESVVTNIKHCFARKIPIVIGTTGWQNQYDCLTKECEAIGSAMLYASNFSIGMNIFFEINSRLAELISKYDYTAKLDETHHIHKLDAPSGTAVTLADQIIDKNSMYKNWELLEETVEIKDDNLPIQSHRIGEVFGTHEITWKSPIDEITIKHQANNRKGFALGSVLAAEFIAGKKGVFSMKDVLL